LPNQGLHEIVAKVKNIILDQIKMETMHGYNAIAVYIAMSDHSQILNASHFRQALGSMQQHAFDAFYPISLQTI
jgi:hypothetical protein